jgi:tetraacyldisaccharide 4'-kinase
MCILADVNLAMHIVRLLLFPFSFLYGGILFLRNKLFDWQIFKSQSSPLPCLVVGNLNTGGTGKTPHTIALAKKLRELNPAILSRGYGRKTHGYIALNAEMSAEESGDEPQLYLQAGIERVAVCEKRLIGLEKMYLDGHRGLVILDDAFQHRALRPDQSILLVPAGRTYRQDYYLPSGDLRDHRCSANRADIVILSEASPELDLTFMRKHLRLKDHQLLFKSWIEYDAIQNWNHDKPFEASKEVVLITAIAKSHRPKKHLQEHFTLVKHFDYRDHYLFQNKDIEAWQAYSKQNPSVQFITTAKDAVRLKAHCKELKGLPLFVLDIHVKIENEDELINHLKKCFKAKE